MRASLTLFWTALLCLVLQATAFAHFGVVIPSQATVTESKNNSVSFLLAFSHPMEQNVMQLEKPVAFTVTHEGKTQDLTAGLHKITLRNHTAWKSTYIFTAPGVYHFALTPQPYFEEAEDCYIQHYTKVVVPAFGAEEGWNAPVGLPTEIVPLSRPFGNYSGNVVQGQVLVAGKPTKATVEVEYYNGDGKRKAPNAYCVTQVVTTDENGVFTYAVPWAGWWGFAALTEAPEKRDWKGTPKAVEWGAVLWQYFERVQ